MSDWIEGGSVFEEAPPRIEMTCHKWDGRKHFIAASRGAKDGLRGRYWPAAVLGGQLAKQDMSHTVLGLCTPVAILLGCRTWPKWAGSNQTLHWTYE